MRLDGLTQGVNHLADFFFPMGFNKENKKKQREEIKHSIVNQLYFNKILKTLCIFWGKNDLLHALAQ